ncbi:MAG TPA: branched-chain amino acid ABC transporter permease [Gammaproteobacteria bacterium]|nr:branched-chain amino acid ABC transporter permease [Gammaproteobacteria bacterium]
MPSLSTLLSQGFNGLILGALLALVSSGLTIILGTLGVLNFAHGALFMLGAYTAYVVLGHTGSYVLAVLAGCAFLAVVGLVLERGLIQYYYDRNEEDQILVTYGLGIMIVEAVRFFFGGNSQQVSVPGWGEGIVSIGSLIYPLYRVQAVVIIAVTLLALYLLLYRTRIGLVVRAGIEDTVMVSMLGINARRTFLLVFALGAAAAGFAGVVYAPIISVNPDMGGSFLVDSFVVIVIGGLGSFPGAVVGGLAAGEIISLTSAFNAAYSDVMLFVVMAAVLVLRPQGLFGVEGRQ